MTESDLYHAFHAAQEAYLAAPSPERAAATVEAFEAFAAEFIEDPIAAAEEAEDLRRRLAALHPAPQAERIVPRWA